MKLKWTNWTLIEHLLFLSFTKRIILTNYNEDIILYYRRKNQTKTLRFRIIYLKHWQDFGHTNYGSHSFEFITINVDLIMISISSKTSNIY